MNTYGLVIHGGAGEMARGRLDAEQQAAYRAALRAALDAGFGVLEAGGSALDAGEAAVLSMEDSPLFNAGRGSVLNHAGQVELDAAVMDGATGQAGAVAGLRRARNPIVAARRVMSETEHVMLIGPGADAFVAAQGLPEEEPEWFWTALRQGQLDQARAAGTTALDHGGGGGKHGTVGAVVLDARGGLSSSTSTGGMTNKRWGRVGDCPLIAAGTWADERVAVSCTGHGEFFIRAAAAHSVAARVRWAGASVEAAAAAVVAEIGARGGAGGLIAIGADGEVAMPYNCGGMFRGVRLSSGRREVRIWAD